MFTALGTNQTLVLQAAAVAPNTNTAAAVSGAALAGPAGQAPPRKVSDRTTRTHPPPSESKGAIALMAARAKSSSTGKPPSPAHQVPATPGSAPLTPEQVEAKLVAAIQVSGDEQRDLIKQRAQAVQSAILKTGTIAAERLFIITPKPAGASAKGESRVNLSLN